MDSDKDEVWEGARLVVWCACVRCVHETRSECCTAVNMPNSLFQQSVQLSTWQSVSPRWVLLPAVWRGSARDLTRLACSLSGRSSADSEKTAARRRASGFSLIPHTSEAPNCLKRTTQGENAYERIQLHEIAWLSSSYISGSDLLASQCSIW